MAVLYRGLAWVCLQRVRDTVKKMAAMSRAMPQTQTPLIMTLMRLRRAVRGTARLNKPRALEMTVVVEGKEAQEGKETQDEADTNNIASF